jgi:antitoxin HigA-1
MIRVPTHREPTHPGEMLVQEFLKPIGLTQRDLVQGIYVPYQHVNELVNRRRGLTPSTALRPAKYFGTSPDYWMLTFPFVIRSGHPSGRAADGP